MSTETPTTATAAPTDKQITIMGNLLVGKRDLCGQDLDAAAIDLLGQHLDEIRGYHRHGRTCPAGCPICGHIAWATAVIAAHSDLVNTAGIPA